eukprot:TRINITY_DN4668_c0_g1_i1.p1 TRINITY_DN4668_c0_g1~~TRINITY_DN4668_c0_g1_i1.p1  ORF type:complete len:324 (+),score=77.47 TRINITY_DN4668_c0_g1_i1:53-1024(+)
MVKCWNILLIVVVTISLVYAKKHKPTIPVKPIYLEDGESTHLKDIKQITNGGTNAEAYFSFDNKRLSFQAITGPLGETHPCDQIYSMNIDGSDIQQVSTGKGRDTCSFYYPDGKHMLYSSTMAYSSYCAPVPDPDYGYVWPIYKEMEIFQVDLGTGELVQLTDNDAYDAETTISPTGDFAVFTSTRDGDLEIYSMALNGSDVRRLTYTPGYDGGPVISYNGKMVAWRADRPIGQALTDYLNLLELGIVMPTQMELYVLTDVNNPLSVVQLTNNGKVNFAPYFLPDDSGLIFSSSILSPHSSSSYFILSYSILALLVLVYLYDK